MASNRHGWLQDLEALSPTITGLNLRSHGDEAYGDAVTNRAIHVDALNFSSCPNHNAAIARWIDALAANGVSQSQLSTLLVRLTSPNNTYGTFCELSGYGLLLDAQLPFQTQVRMTGRAILNPNGADLDGRLTIGGEVLFDIKAFGLHEHLANRLEERLSGDISSQFVAIEGSADMGVSEMESLLGRDYPALVTELRTRGVAKRGPLDISLRPLQPIQITTGILDPYEFTKNNAEYAFQYAKQFARRKPFMLIFVIHPWRGGLRLNANFPGDTDVFLRSFARRTFMQFRRDRAKLFGVTRAHASRLLSGIMFINAWQPPDSKIVHRLFLNPHAKHPIPGLTVRHLQVGFREELREPLFIDDFRNDTY